MFLNNYMTKNVSPHVSIYKFPITAISSIATRLSGLYLSGLFVGCGIVLLNNKEDILKEKYKNSPYFLRLLVNQSIALPLSYHTYGGIRHFIWDKYPSLLNNKQVSRSSFMIFGLSIGTSFLLEKKINYKLQNIVGFT